MECNRDEAIRAKGIAEKKMHNNDFEGARKIALKARQLFPELENISQLLAVCDVHCSAESKIYGSEKDLYGILQVERLADEATIRKQYRKLALILHPDKNKFPGAEAAFKLIGEANMVLSEKSKRQVHDLRCKDSARIAAQKQTRNEGHQSSSNRPQFVAQNKVPNASNFQFSGSTHHQTTQSGLENGRESFWTVCPFCNIKYQYYREFVKRALRCQTCTKPFIAYDMGSYMGRTGLQSKNPASTWGQPAVSQQKEAPKPGSFEASKQSTKGFSSFCSGAQTNTAIGVETNPLKKTESTVPGLDLKTKVKQNGRSNLEEGKERVAMPKADVTKPREAGTSRNTNRKRMRNTVVESSESGGNGSNCDMEEVVFDGSGGKATAGQDSGLGNGYARRSSRQKQNVSYSENANGNDDISSPPKRSRETKPSGDGKEEQKEEISSHKQFKSGHSADVPVASAVDKKILKQTGSAHAEGIGKDGKQKAEEAKLVTGNDQSEAKSDSDCDSEPEVFECPDPEFSDFDKIKEEHCFAVGQIWACYDTIDGMPRFYALVRKVYSPGFKLQITWLEADPVDKGEIDWVEEGLPVACGEFKRGNSENTSDRLTFSHQPSYGKGRGRGTYVVYPRTGETWALFKGWDIKWSSDPENHRKYKYEIVEVLSDFVPNIGVQVAFLEKVQGFVSLFQKTSQTGISDSLIPANQLLRFSHRVPSFKMTGTERQGVPRGSFELDPAALPTDPEDLFCSNEVKMETESMDANGSCPKSSEEKLKSKMGNEKMSTPKKCVKSEGNNALNQEPFMPRRSPRELNKVDKNDNHVQEGSCSTQEGTLKHPNGIKNKSTCVTPSKGTAFQVKEEVFKSMDTSSNDISKTPSKKSEEVFHDFCAEKSEGRFEVGQIWALYKGEGEMPRNYAQIKKIESSPFRLYAASLESCAPPTYACCGIFKVCIGKSKLYQPSSFSHLVKAECNGKNRFNIYPQVQEVWAIYKNWNAESTFCDLEKSEYDIVEVLESSVQCIKVLFLLRVNDTKSVFRAPRIQRSTIGITTIPKVELARFSHQIPAFQLTGEKDGRLRGCWELDPASLPGLGSHEVTKS